MDPKTVKDLMVPLDDYPTARKAATVVKALLIFDEANKKRDRARQPYRAVLIVDRTGKVVGKVGHMDLLRALEPRRNILGDMGKTISAGVSPDFIKSITKHFQFYDDNLSELCRRARNIEVNDIMRPLVEHIAEDAPMGEAITKMVAWNTLSLLVMRGDNATGLLRISDLCQEIAEKIVEDAGK